MGNVFAYMFCGYICAAFPCWWMMKVVGVREINDINGVYTYVNTI